MAFLSLFLLAVITITTVSGSQLTFTFNSDDSNCAPQCSTRTNATTINQLVDTVNHVLLLVEELRNNSSVSPLPTSCQDIKERAPTSPSGTYLIAPSDGVTQSVYCNMEHPCGSSGGWRRVAYLNMSDPSEECPSELQQYTANGVRGCGRKVANGGSCNGLSLSTGNMSYSEVCGRVIGYQIGSPDAFWPSNNRGTGIDSYYVDGVSLTHGSPRQHIWTFAVGLQENSIHLNGQFECPCSTGSTQTVPSFVGNDYFCESGSTCTYDQVTFHSQDPLWNGKECGLIETDCCNVTGIPWFHKVLNSFTTDDLEMRVCGDQLAQRTIDENVAVGLYEIYVK